MRESVPSLSLPVGTLTGHYDSEQYTLILNKKDFLKLSILTLVIFGLIVAWLAFGERGFIHLFRMEKERQVYLKKIQDLEKANNELLEQIHLMQNDDDYLERLARKELGLVKENEVIYRFSDD
jgi:cell division protein FtsB